MTTDITNFRDFVLKTPDADLRREVIGFAADHLMEQEVGAVTCARYGENVSLASLRARAWIPPKPISRRRPWTV